MDDPRAHPISKAAAYLMADCLELGLKEFGATEEDRVSVEMVLTDLRYKASLPAQMYWWFDPQPVLSEREPQP